MNTRLTVFRLALAAGLLCGITAAWSQSSADVALVNQLTGEVTYVAEGGKPSKAQVFMRVRQGDRFTVSAGGLVRVVYLKGGRQESWKGPASFRAGPAQSDKLSGASPAVEKLPTDVPQKIARVPELIQAAKLGGITIRNPRAQPPLSAQDRAEVAEARATYKKMRASAAPDDVTPELYLFSVLQDFSLYEELKPVAEDMQRRQPASAEIRELAEWAKSRATPARK
jgi:hypothetical protein